MQEKKNNIYKMVLFLAIPMMIQNGITNAVGLVDNLMVGSLGTESMTGVSIIGQLIFVFNLAIFGALSGPGIYGAQYYGNKNLEGVRDVFRLKIWLCLGCLILGLLVFLFGDTILIGAYLHGTDPSIDPALTLNLAQQYLHIMMIGFLPFTITQIYSSTLRETGDSFLPMVAGVLSVVVDVIFNYLLIYGKFGFPQLGVRGAAIATVLARFAEMGMLVSVSHMTMKKHEFLHGIYTRIKVSFNVCHPIIRKSIPVFINELLWAAGLAAMTQCYSLRGLSVVAGLNISNVLCNLLNVVFVAMGGAVGIIVGQMLGASKFEEAKKDSVKLMWFCGIVCFILTAILLSISGIFPKFYMTTEEVRSYGTHFIIITALFFPLQGFLNALYFTLRSGGKTIVTFIFDSLYSWVICVPVAFVLCRFTVLPILVVFAIVQSLDFIKVTVGYIMIQKGIWISNLVAN